MKKTTIRRLKHETSVVLGWVAAGATVEVRHRNQPVAILSPPRRRIRVARPDFAWPSLQPAPVPRYRSVEAQARAVEAACRTAIQLLEGAPDRDRMRARVDPVPQSTRAHLRRLAARSRDA